MAEGMLPPVVVELVAKAGEFKTEMGAARAEVGRFESTSAKAMHGFSQVGKAALLGVAGATAVIGYESVKMAGEFQKDTNLLVTAAGESQASLGKVRQGIKDIATETGTSLTGLTEGMYEVEKAGFRGADGLKILRSAAQGAAEEGARLDTVTNAMTSVMASYHISASKSVNVMNALKTAAGSSKTNMEMFSASLSTVLPIASAAGLSFEQVGGAIAALTRHGTSAHQATQDLANTIRNLQAPNRVAIKMMEQFGVSSTDLSKNLGKRGLGGTLDILVDTIGKHMGPSGLVMIDTFKKSQSSAADLQAMLQGMPAPLKKLSDQFEAGSLSTLAFRKAAKALGPEQEVMGQQFERLWKQSHGFSDALRQGTPQATTMAAALKAMMGGSTGLNTALMLTGENTEYLNEVTKRTKESLTNSSKSVEGWESTSKLFNIQLAKLHQSFNVLMVNIGTRVIPILQSSAAFMMKHKDIAMVFAGVVGTVLVAAITLYVYTLAKAAVATAKDFGKMALSAARWAAAQALAFAEAMLPLLPIILVLAAIGVAAYELYTHWDQVWGFIKRISSDAAGFVVDVFQAFVSGVSDLIKGLVDFVHRHIRVIIGIIFLINPPLALVLAAVHFLWKHWSTIWNAIGTAVHAVWNGVLKPVFGFIVDMGLAYIRTEVKILKAVWDAVWGSLSAAASAVWDFLKPILTAIVKFGLHLIRDEITTLKRIWDTAWGGIQSTVESVWHAIKPIINAIKGALGDVGGALGKLGGAAGKLPGGLGKMLGFSEGGEVPGPKGAPRLAIVHGGEYVLSNAMQAAGAPRAITPLVRPSRGSLGTGEGGGAQTVVVPVYLDKHEIARVTAPVVRDHLIRDARSMPNIFGGVA